MSERTDWTVDPARSEIRFTSWSLWGLLPVRGRFPDPRGSLRIEEDGVLSGVLSVDAASVDTGIIMRDRHLRQERFLDADHHPALTVEADGCRLVDGIVTGDALVTVRGTAVSLPVSAHAQHDDGTMTVTCEVAVPLARFGVKIPLGFIRPTLVVNVAIGLVRSSVSPKESSPGLRTSPTRHP